MNASADEACRLLNEFDVFFREHAVYLPKSMARRVYDVYSKLGNMAAGGRIIRLTSCDIFEEKSLQGYRDFQTEVQGLYENLQDEFREHLGVG